VFSQALPLWGRAFFMPKQKKVSQSDPYITDLFFEIPE
jgi:hypothetical protein